jgi:nickel-dependent lactate racemase
LNSIKGKDHPPLSHQGKQWSFSHPLNSPTIQALAKKRKDVVIIFDDMARPTPVADIVPYVLEELELGGIRDEQVRFIVANGAHRTHTRLDFEKKLGRNVLARFPVYNHNPYENCIFVGKTSRGSSVLINAEVMACDLKIGIGCVVPHITAGFGGGGKIILPGVAHIDTLHDNHSRLGGRGKPAGGNILGNIHPTVGLGKVENNIMALDQLEAAKMVGLDTKIDAIVDLKRRITHLFVGDVTAVRTEGVRVAREFYLTEQAQEMDVVVVNAYSKGNEAGIAMLLGAQSLKKEGGDLVLISHTPEGQIPHYWSGSFGKDRGGRAWGPRPLPPRVNRMIFFSPYPDLAGCDFFGPLDSIKCVSSWNEVMSILESEHKGGTKVVIYPDATVQYFGAEAHQLS